MVASTFSKRGSTHCRSWVTAVPLPACSIPLTNTNNPVGLLIVGGVCCRVARRANCAVTNANRSVSLSIEKRFNGLGVKRCSMTCLLNWSLTACGAWSSVVSFFLLMPMLPLLLLDNILCFVMRRYTIFMDVLYE